MTNKQQSEVRATAAALETLDMGGVADLVRRQYAELETLREKLKTYEDLGDAGSDVQLLRMGYAAARLEIESLNAQLHAAKQINAAQFGLLAASIPGNALRVSHGQAPAGAAEPTEQQILEAAFAPAQPAVEASRFGSPELQAMIIARCVEKDLAGSVLEDAAPAHAGEYPALVCDYCGALTPDPWHSSGMLHGKMSKHIHSCDACCRGATQPSPAAQGDALDAEVLRDAERYRFIRDVPYSDDVRSVLVHQQNAAMDRVIDAARAAQEGKSHD